MQSTLAQHYWLHSLSRSRISERAFATALVIAASWAIAIAAQVKIPLGFSPVPLTLQSFAVIVLAAALGRTRGVAAVGLYLLQGLAGLPFFAGGASGLAYALGPTGGYLAGFVASAWLVGTLAERRWDRSRARAWLLFVSAHSVIFVLGVGWLSRYVGSLPQAIAMGWLPFVPGEILKSGLAALLLPGMWGALSPVAAKLDKRG